MNKPNPATIFALHEALINKDGVYEGNLAHYFRVIFRNATNLQTYYHNFRHMFHIFWLGFQAAIFYGDRESKRTWRNMLIGGLFHDYNHTGKYGPDSVNIERAIAGLEEHILDEDRPYLSEICGYIRATEFPYTIDGSVLTLPAQILRDADKSQAMDSSWIQQVIFGLAGEWEKRPIDILRMQPKFLSGLKYDTEWALQKFGPEAIARKIEESRELLKLLGTDENANSSSPQMATA